MVHVVSIERQPVPACTSEVREKIVVVYIYTITEPNKILIVVWEDVSVSFLVLCSICF